MDYIDKVKTFLVIFILIYVLVLNLYSQAHAANIKFGIDTSNTEPLLYQFDDPNYSLATGGFVYEINVAIAEELNQEYSILTLPRSRMLQALKDGHLDLVCHGSPQWNQYSIDDFLWSDSLYTFSKVLVGKKEIPFKNLEKTNNITVGTVERYLYPELEAKFRNQNLQRVDSPSTVTSLNKLLDGRLDYIVMSDIEFNFHKMTYPQLHKSSFAFDKTKLQCALSKKSSLTLKKLNTTIAQLKNKKTFQRIYSRYSHADTIPRPINYGMNDSNSPPFLVIDSETASPAIKGGLFFDLGLEVGRKLKRPIRFILSPRKRLDSGLANGEIELVCYNTEAWAGDFAKDYNWSIPIFKQSNLIVGLKTTMKNTPLKYLKDLSGKTLGTALGFIYPALIPYFKDGRIKREDAISGLDNITKLQSERVQYIVLNNLEYNYYKNKFTRLQEAAFAFDQISVKCASSKKSDLKISDVNTAITELMKSGRLQKVFLPQ